MGCMSRDVLLATAVGAVGLTVGAGVMYCYKYVHDQLRKGQGQPQGHACLVRCKCDEQSPSCEKHDQKLLHEISKLITKSDVLMDLGIAVNIKKSIIETVQEDHKSSINRAALELLYKLYFEMDGLRENSKGLKKLRKALKKVGLNKYNAEIIDRHFEDR